MNKSIALLSGGLDSLVSLGLTKDDYNVELALTFDYGQEAVTREIEASSKICEYYEIEQKIIKLDWLKKLISSDEIWVPNRNGLFLNVAASVAEARGFDYIIFGANREEAQNFPDNSKEFVQSIEAEFALSTKNKVKVIAPLIDLEKNEIVKLALKKKIPLEYTYSCYGKSKKNCGQCPSCLLLKSALEDNDDKHYIKELF